MSVDKRDYENLKKEVQGLKKQILANEKFIADLKNDYSYLKRNMEKKIPQLAKLIGEVLEKPRDNWAKQNISKIIEFKL